MRATPFLPQKEKEMKLNDFASRAVEETIRKGLGKMSREGALLVDTGNHTGRAAQERFIVRNPFSESEVHWGNTNQPIDLETSDAIETQIQFRLESGDSYHYQGFAGGFPIEVTSTSPWHIAFASNMFRKIPVKSILEKIKNSDRPGQKIQIFHDPFGDISKYGIDSLPRGITNTIIQLNAEKLTVCIVGTAYAGEIKKSAFTLCNFVLPAMGILPMHASASVARTSDLNGESCVLFGLSGTGKTTLSASPNRLLIGDDEIIWTSTGLSNLEGGCYAKLIDLKEANEPEIYRATNRPGAILENVVYDEDSQSVIYSDRSKTENTRGSYSLEALGEVYPQDREANPPKTIVFLTADAFGALPAVAKLNSWQARYHFMSGYTAKVAGTEIGVKEPVAAFSCCFGAPFMPRPAHVYAEMLAEHAKNVDATFWLLNTGWVDGYPKGERFPIYVSRKLLFEIQSGKLQKQKMKRHSIFGFEVPEICPGIEDEWLKIPEGGHVRDLAQRFKANFKSYFGESCQGIADEGGPCI